MKAPYFFQKFTKSNYPEYKSWFEDEQLQQTLGGVDQEWLDYILHAEGQMEMAVFSNNMLIAVIGIVCPGDQQDHYVITNIAIKPSLRGQGIGSTVLLQLLEEIQLKQGEHWVSYVEKSNAIGMTFFEKQGWDRFEEDEMMKYELRR